MRIGRDLTLQPFVQRGVRGQVGIRRVEPRPDDLLEVSMFCESQGLPHTGSQTLPVKGVCQVVIVQRGLDVWIARCQPELT